MRYYGARQIMGEDGQGTGKWHYTVTHDKVTRPTGPCADGCPGHDSPEAACEHYAEQLRQNVKVVRKKLDLPPCRWEGCSRQATHELQVPYAEIFIDVCGEHLQPSHQRQLVKAGEAAIS